MIIFTFNFLMQFIQLLIISQYFLFYKLNYKILTEDGSGDK